MTVTPSPQSVVVPVELMTLSLKAAEQFIVNGIETGYVRLPDYDDDPAHSTLPLIRDALALLSVAPAPSSLAGGEVEKLRALLERHQEERRMVRMKDTGAVYDTTLDLDTKLALAALSPEAPARDGVVMAATDVPMWADGIATDGENVAMAQKAEADHGGHYWAVDGGNGGLDWEPTHFISLDALTPRHEAPAEGAGDGHMSDCAIHNAPALPVGPCDCGSPFLTPEDIKRAHELRADPDSEDNERFASWYGDTLLEVHQRAIQMDAALRARSSAPEAREEALGNLLAVIHGDGGHRALEVGTKQAALEAEKIVAGLFAAPSADKLREEVTRDQIMGVVRQYAAPAWCSVDRMADALVAIMSPASAPDALKGGAKP